jgi:hypothetical protein
MKSKISMVASGFEHRIIGTIRRLSEASDPVEALAIDEIKAAVRAIVPHLPLTDGDLNRYIAEAKQKNSAWLIEYVLRNTGKLEKLKDGELAKGCEQMNARERLTVARKFET